jgi:hypothetical protein
MLRLERHELGPRVYVLRRRIHEYHLGFGILSLRSAGSRVPPLRSAQRCSPSPRSGSARRAQRASARSCERRETPRSCSRADRLPRRARPATARGFVPRRARAADNGVLDLSPAGRTSGAAGRRRAKTRAGPRFRLCRLRARLGERRGRRGGGAARTLLVLGRRDASALEAVARRPAAARRAPRGRQRFFPSALMTRRSATSATRLIIEPSRNRSRRRGIRTGRAYRGSSAA